MTVRSKVPSRYSKQLPTAVCSTDKVHSIFLSRESYEKYFYLGTTYNNTTDQYIFKSNNYVKGQSL